MRIIGALALLGLAPGILAQTWNCRNPDMEISCSDGHCQSTEEHSFTPMDVAFNDAGEMFLCAYSGCWEGRGEVTKSARFLSIAATNLTYSTDPKPGEMKQHAAILLDLSDNIALLKLGSYAQPLVCNVTEE